MSRVACKDCGTKHPFFDPDDSDAASFTWTCKNCDTKQTVRPNNQIRVNYKSPVKGERE